MLASRRQQPPGRKDEFDRGLHALKVGRPVVRLLLQAIVCEELAEWFECRVAVGDPQHQKLFQRGLAIGPTISHSEQPLLGGELAAVDGCVGKLLGEGKQERFQLGWLGLRGEPAHRLRQYTGIDLLAVALDQRVAQLVDQVKQLGAGLSESATFLLSLKHDAAQPTMAGFNIPSQLLHLEEFKKAANIFMSADGHSVRYLVQTRLNPFSTEAMDQVNAISATARGAQPNTALADAQISMAGFTVGLKDTRDYYEHDIRFIIAITLFVVLLTLIALLRAIVAPLYLVASVVISYLSAVGIGVLFFQFILGQHLHWSVPPLAFVVLVAVGADYNMLLVSRMRDESPHSVRYGIVRTLSSTGGVITAAGVIFAASMCGLLFSSIGTVVQGGFVIGVGILLDTFLVRTITVPAMAALVGRANWWPSRAAMRRSGSRSPAVRAG